MRVRSKKEQRLLTALEAAACSHGFDLVDLEQTGSGNNTLLRVYIDKPGSLTLDDIASANTWVAEVVEALDPYKGSYTLEVSSPGIDRPLRVLAHFEKAIGEEAVVSLDAASAASEALAGDEAGRGSEDKPGQGRPRLRYTGTIVAVDTERQLVMLEADGHVHALEFAHIKKARVKGRLDFEGRKDS